MNARLLLGSVVAGLLVFAGCGKKQEPPPQPAAPKTESAVLVPKSEQSRHFQIVNSHLELGGTLYAYADLDGDFQKLATQLDRFATQLTASSPKPIPFLKQDYPALMSALGLDGIKAAGISSVPDGTGYFRNKVFIYIPDGRKGLLAAFGGAPAPFQRLDLAPPNTDVYLEAEVDLPVVYSTVSKIVEMTSGKEMAGKLEQALRDTGKQAAFSVLSLIQDWKGRMAFVARVDPQATITLPTPRRITLPAFSFLVSIDGIAPAVRDTLVKLPVFTVRKEGNIEIFEPKQPLPLQGIKPVIEIEGSTLMIATSPGFLAECRAAGPHLSDEPGFKDALARVGTEGNGLAYVTPNFFKRIADIRTLNPGLPPQAVQSLNMVLSELPQGDKPLVAVRKNLPDGILVESYWNRSLKRDVAAIAVYNPVTIGILAAMAVPAFNKVREASREKAVMNNLRMFSGAADQYMMETGKTLATYNDLVGPGRYIPSLNPVAGEDYHSLQVTPLTKSLSVRLASGKVVTFRR